MEWKIGEIRQVNGEWYQCIEGNCAYCSLKDEACEQRIINDVCKLNRIFKKLEKVGEPYTTYVDKTVQNYLLETAVSVPPENVFVLINNEQRLIAIEIKQNKEDMEERELDPRMAKVIDEATQKMGEEIGRQIEANINKQRMKPFNLEAAKAGKPVCTRDGRKARIICFDKRKDIYPLIALVTNKDGYEIITPYKADGAHPTIPNNDLMMLPEKKEGWINVYALNTCYSSKEEAEANIERDYEHEYVRTVKIEWEE